MSTLRSTSTTSTTRALALLSGAGPALVAATGATATTAAARQLMRGGSLFDCSRSQSPRDSGASSKKNWGFCSSECREAAKKAPRRQCEHGRQKSRCRDCGTGHYCEHGRQKRQCKYCGTGYCEHGRPKHQCKDCGKGHCLHGRQKHHCRDCWWKAIGDRQQAIGNRQ